MTPDLYVDALHFAARAHGSFAGFAAGLDCRLATPPGDGSGGAKRGDQLPR